MKVDVIREKSVIKVEVGKLQIAITVCTTNMIIYEHLSQQFSSRRLKIPTLDYPTRYAI